MLFRVYSSGFIGSRLRVYRAYVLSNCEIRKGLFTSFPISVWGRMGCLKPRGDSFRSRV